MGDFLSFRKNVTPVLIMLLYVMGAIGIVVLTVRVFDEVFFAFLFLIAMELSWRIVCEVFMILFKIHNELVNLNNSSAYNAAHSVPTAIPTAEAKPFTNAEGFWFCPHCQSKNPKMQSFCVGCGKYK